MLVVYKEDSTSEETLKTIMDMIQAEGRSSETPRWDIVEQGESFSWTGCYAEQLGYPDVFFSFIPNQEKQEEMKEDGMVVFDFVWQSSKDFDIKWFQDAHLSFQKYLLNLFPDIQTVVQITSKPTMYDYVTPTK